MRRSGLGAAAETTLALGVDGLAAGSGEAVVDVEAHPAAIHTPAEHECVRPSALHFESSRGFTSVTRYGSEPFAACAASVDLGVLVGIDIRANLNTYSFCVARR